MKIKSKQIISEEEFLKNLQEIKSDLYKVAKARLLQDEDIYDAIQETIIISYEYIKKGRTIENFKSWAIKVLINECNHIYKKQKKQIDLFEKKLKQNKKEDNLIEKIDDKIVFDKFLASLQYKDRLIISLYYGSRFTTKEISNILRMNENTVKTRISRVKKQIKEQMEGGN